MRKIATHDGQDILEARLESDLARIDVMNYGAVIKDWRIAGESRAMVLGFPDFETYPAHSRAHGTIAGRVANRTGSGRFSMAGQDYQLEIAKPPHHLHGGPEGLGSRIWDMAWEGDTLVLRHTSPDGHMGYPGEVAFTVRMRLEGAKLSMEMSAKADRLTPINLAQHNYYTLGAEFGVRDLIYWADADRYTPSDETLLPIGEIRSVTGTRYDFTQARSSRAADPAEEGIDINLVLRDGRDIARPCCTLRNPVNGVELKMWTDQPGLQTFNSWHFQFDVDHHDGYRVDGYPGFALEPQHFPDSLNNPEWPSILHGPDRPYRQMLEVEILKA